MYVTPRNNKEYRIPKTKPNITSIGKCTPKISLEIAIIMSKIIKMVKTNQL